MAPEAPASPASEASPSADRPGASLPRPEGACPSDEALMALAGGQLGEGERAGLEAHLAGCSDCRSVLAAIAPLLDAHATTVLSSGAGPSPSGPASGPDSPSSAGPEPLSKGQVLVDRYRVTGPLGAGGMGVVYEAEHLTLGARVAIKLIRPERGARPEVVARFLREARTAARLSGPHVCRVLDAGVLPDGRAFVAMEKLEGEDLASLSRRRGPLPVGEAIELVTQACEGLDEAHAIGVVHRDVKPANLFLARTASGSEAVKVLDFGLAKALSPAASEPSSSSLTSDSHLIGSPAYMAPEQIRAPRGVDARADVWSLGVVLHELLCGAPPFSAITAGELWSKILVDPPEPLRSRRPDAPASLEALIARCLEKDPARRFPSARALAEALRQLPADAPSSPSASLASPASPASPEPSPSRAGLPRAAVVASAIALALGSLVAARLALAPSGPAASPPSTLAPSLPPAASASGPSLPAPGSSPPPPASAPPALPSAASLASASPPSPPPPGPAAVVPPATGGARKLPAPASSPGLPPPRPAPTDSRD